jgi:hypothetical protein
MAKSSRSKGFTVKGHYPTVEGFGQLISPIKYVLFQPAKDDYFAGEKRNKSFSFNGRWCSHPAEAKTFSTFLKAKTKAQEITSRKGYTLQICKLYQTDKQAAVVAIAEVRGGSDFSA